MKMRPTHKRVCVVDLTRRICGEFMKTSRSDCEYAALLTHATEYGYVRNFFRGYLLEVLYICPTHKNYFEKKITPNAQ